MTCGIIMHGLRFKGSSLGGILPRESFPFSHVGALPRVLINVLVSRDYHLKTRGFLPVISPLKAQVCLTRGLITIASTKKVYLYCWKE